MNAKPNVRLIENATHTLATVDEPVKVPDYLRDVYSWAYINPIGVRILDHDWVVNTVLWGYTLRLQRALFDELRPGQRVLQTCCVYGNLIPRLARYLGVNGQLDVIDVAPVQVENCRRKLDGLMTATTRQADVARPGDGNYDAVGSFFLLHEMPDGYKRVVVDALLSSMGPDGKVIFIDYHGPHRFHPMRPVLKLIIAFLEPFAESLWRHPITDFASRPEDFTWKSETYFGGLYQKTIARHR